MALLSRTRIMQIGTGTPNAPVPITPTVFRTLNQGVVVETVAEAMAQVAAGQRPPQTDWWMYAVQWQVDFAITIHIRGLRLDIPNCLVFDADFWESIAVRNANPNNPTLRNTFSYQFTSQRLQDALGAIRQNMDSWIIRQFFANLPADGRDQFLQTTTDPTKDPLGILPAVASIDNQTFSVTAEWRSS